MAVRVAINGFGRIGRNASVNRVMISAQPNGATSITFDIIDDNLGKEHLVVLNKSLTTNCSASKVRIMHEAFGIEQSL